MRQDSANLKGWVEDGYRVRPTEDGWVFVEGYPCCQTDRFFTPQETANFNACLARRGIPQLRRKRR